MHIGVVISSLTVVSLILRFHLLLVDHGICGRCVEDNLDIVFEERMMIMYVAPWIKSSNVLGSIRNGSKLSKHCLARDIVSIIACEGPQRVERHELLGKWRRRFAMAGFAPSPLSPFGNDTIKHLLKSYCGGV